MTVYQLIEALQDYEPTATVLIDYAEHETREVQFVTPTKADKLEGFTGVTWIVNESGGEKAAVVLEGK